MKKNRQTIKLESPLRYPGGKGCLAGLLTSVISTNDLRGCRYLEPFAGGAGAALKLLASGAASEIFINDADYRIYCFWWAVLNKSDEFIDRIQNCPVTIPEWEKHRMICENPKRHSKFKVGFSTFFLNRCNRSGVIMKAGPIGGYAQSDHWRMDARFSRDSLSERVRNIANFSEAIKIFNCDGMEFLEKWASKHSTFRKLFVYLDPPYFRAGPRLYYNSFTPENHKELSCFVQKQQHLSWLVSYDRSQEIIGFFDERRIFEFELQYRLAKKRIGNEILIFSDNLTTPRTAFIDGKTQRLSPVAQDCEEE